MMIENMSNKSLLLMFNVYTARNSFLCDLKFSREFIVVYICEWMRRNQLKISENLSKNEYECVWYRTKRNMIEEIWMWDERLRTPKSSSVSLTKGGLYTILFNHHTLLKWNTAKSLNFHRWLHQTIFYRFSICE